MVIVLLKGEEWPHRVFPPKKKWIRHYLEEFSNYTASASTPPYSPVVQNGHATSSVSTSPSVSATFCKSSSSSSSSFGAGIASTSGMMAAPVMATNTVGGVNFETNHVRASRLTNGYHLLEQITPTTTPTQSPPPITPPYAHHNHHNRHRDRVHSVSRMYNASPPDDAFFPSQYASSLAVAAYESPSTMHPHSFRSYAFGTSDSRRRFNNNGTREVHNKLEKNRRAHLRDCFEKLKSQIPSIKDDKKQSNLNILITAQKYINLIKKRDFEYTSLLEQLKQEKKEKEKILASLKNELSAQWDHIDFNALLPTSAEIPPVPEMKCDVDICEMKEEFEIEKRLTSDTDDSQVKSRDTTYSSTSSISSISPLQNVVSAAIDGYPPQIQILETQLNGTNPNVPLELTASNVRIVSSDLDSFMSHRSDISSGAKAMVSPPKGKTVINGKVATIRTIEGCNKTVLLPEGQKNLNSTSAPPSQFYTTPILVSGSNGVVVSTGTNGFSQHKIISLQTTTATNGQIPNSDNKSLRIEKPYTILKTIGHLQTINGQKIVTTGNISLSAAMTTPQITTPPHTKV